MNHIAHFVVAVLFSTGCSATPDDLFLPEKAAGALEEDNIYCSSVLDCPVGDPCYAWSCVPYREPNPGNHLAVCVAHRVTGDNCPVKQEPPQARFPQCIAVDVSVYRAYSSYCMDNGAGLTTPAFCFDSAPNNRLCAPFESRQQFDDLYCCCDPDGEADGSCIDLYTIAVD